MTKTTIADGAGARAGTASHPGRRLRQWRWRWQARGALALGWQGAALRALDASLQQSPHDAHALASRSHLFAAQGRWTLALADAQTLTAAHPQRAAADWFNLGFVHDVLGQSALAEAAFRHALRMQDDLALAWLGLGRVLARTPGRADEALAAWARHNTLQPWAPEGRAERVRLLLQLGRGDEARAEWAQLRGFEPQAAWQLLQALPALSALRPGGGDDVAPAAGA